MHSSRTGGQTKALKRFDSELVLQTKRLTLNALDLENLYHYVHHYEVVHQNLDATCQIETHDPDVAYAFEAAYYEATNDPAHYYWYTSWELILKTDSEIVGGLCFKGPPDEKGQVEIGYAIYEGHEGKGYATEGLEALIRWAFKDADVKAVIASVQPSNSRSRRVLEKLGFNMIEMKDALQWWQKNK